MNSPSLRTRFADAPRALVLAGLLLTVLLTMLRPSGAQALLPASALVFTDSKETSQYTINIDGKPTVQRDYDIVLDKQKTATKVTLTGVPLADLFAGLDAEVDVTKVPYVKIRFGDSDAYSMLVALNGGPDATPPPMILTKGERPGKGSFPSPSIVPGQPDLALPISETSIVPFDRRKDKLSVVPMTGRIFGVKISHTKRNKKGQIRFTANPVGAPSGALSYQWYAFDDDGAPRPATTSKSWTTDNARGATAVHGVRVVVTAAADGSTGTQTDSYVSSRVDDGATKDPGYGNDTGTGTGTGPGTGPGIGPGTGPGTGTGPGAPAPPTPSAPFTAPPTTPPATSTPAPTPPTSQPTPPTSSTTAPSTETPVVDTSGVVKAAKNVSATGALTTVNGVLLGTSSENAAGGDGGGGGGSTPGLTPLQQSAASLAESIFKPVDDPRDLWPYLVTLLFALGISGGVREWINP